MQLLLVTHFGIQRHFYFLTVHLWCDIVGITLDTGDCRHYWELHVPTVAPPGVLLGVLQFGRCRVFTVSAQCTETAA